MTHTCSDIEIMYRELSINTFNIDLQVMLLKEEMDREPHRGGRTHTFTAEQETKIVNMACENNGITRFTVLYCSLCVPK